MARDSVQTRRPELAPRRSNKGRFVIKRNAATASMREAIPATSVAVSVPTIEAMLDDLPTAHPALPIGRRIAGHGCHGARSPATPAGAGFSVSPHAARIRFVYFSSNDDGDRRMACHHYLVHAEVLLGRVLAARAAGLRPMAPALDQAAEARALVRPPRGLFHAATLEHRRWFDADGSARTQPLSQESLAAQLALADGLPMEEARHRAAHRSHALPAADQAWLIDRRNTPLSQRPLDQTEFQALASAIDGVWQACAGSSHGERANRRIALCVAAMLGDLLDEYIAAPFEVDALAQAFTERHLIHLRQTIESSRQAESSSGVLLTGPTAWFAAKAARMRAEHQIGLAMSPSAFPALRLSTRPVIAVVGGRLRTFVHGWHRGTARAEVTAGAFTAFI
jgi:hypothetical protein